MSITKETTLNENSFLQYLKKKTEIDYKRSPPKANTLTASKYKLSKIPTADLCCLNVKNAIRNRPTTGILLLRIPPLLFVEKGKLENDVDHKINKLSPEPCVSK